MDYVNKILGGGGNQASGNRGQRPADNGQGYQNGVPNDWVYPNQYSEYGDAGSIVDEAKLEKFA